MSDMRAGRNPQLEHWHSCVRRYVCETTRKTLPLSIPENGDTAVEVLNGHLAGLMDMRRFFILLTGLLFGFGISAPGQTRLKLSAIKPGTEQVQMIPNGDFQFQGSLVGGNYPAPADWNRSGDMFATMGSNMMAINNG